MFWSLFIGFKCFEAKFTSLLSAYEYFMNIKFDLGFLFSKKKNKAFFDQLERTEIFCRLII
jgi:hypothetical protein